MLPLLVRLNDIYMSSHPASSLLLHSISFASSVTIGVNVRSTWNNGGKRCARTLPPCVLLVPALTFPIFSPSLLLVGYVSISGTSMACPHVAGVAALVLAYQKKQGKSTAPAGIFTAITASAEHLGNGSAPGRNNAYGYGLVSALRAIDYIAGVSSTPDPPTDPPTDPDPDPDPPATPTPNFQTLLINLRTDDFASENSFSLRSSDGFEWNLRTLRNNRTYKRSASIDMNGCYRFRIKDSYGDGIFGRGFVLKLDGVVDFRGGDIGYGGFIDYGDGC
jgi:hypothetical protein